MHSAIQIIVSKALIAISILFLLMSSIQGEVGTPPLQIVVTAESQTYSLSKEAKAPLPGVYLQYQVRNVSDQPIDFHCSNCGHCGRWTTDNKAVYDAISCRRNLAFDKKLEPDQIIEGRFPITVRKGTPLGDTQFRVGFTPEKSPTFWSEPITIKVEK